MNPEYYQSDQFYHDLNLLIEALNHHPGGLRSKSFPEIPDLTAELFRTLHTAVWINQPPAEDGRTKTYLGLMFTIELDGTLTVR